MLVKHGLSVQPRITITPALVCQCLNITIFGFNLRSLQELCASAIHFNRVSKALLSHYL